MHIECYKNNGIAYLRLCKNVPGVNGKGENCNKKRTVLNIGSLSKFDDGKENYLPRLRESFRNGKPLIDSLRPFVSKVATINDKVTVAFEQNTDDCVGSPKIFSHVLLDQLLSFLGLNNLLTLYKSRNEIDYDLLGLFRLLVFGRILKPASKISTYFQKDEYYNIGCKSENPYAIYNVLDVIYENKIAIMRRMNSSITKSIGRNTNLVFYDVTNFYFEVEYSDDDEVDGDLIKKGLRQRGVSKENKKSPIVQMGLFMDDNGIPISIETFPGNTLDQATLRPALSNTIDTFNLSRFILVADRGLNSYKNIAHLLSNGHGYIVSKSIKKSTALEKEWILKDDYINVSPSYKYKSRIVKKDILDEHGNKVEIEQKVIVYWSEKFYNKEYHEHKSFIDFIKVLKENPTSFRVTSTHASYLKKFLKNKVENIKTGEMIKNKDLLGIIDFDKLEEFTAYMGYYQIVTSEIELSEQEVINKYHGLSRIENQFRAMKSNLETRPVYVRTREHIEAHLITCLIALTVTRLIQHKILLHKKDYNPNLNWSEGLSIDRMQAALLKWQVDKFPEGYHRFNNINNPDLKTILDSFNINIEKRLYSANDLRKIKGKISKL